MKLNNDDIDTLMEALDELEKAAGKDAMLGSMLSMMLIDDKEKARAESHRELDEAKAKSAGMKDKIILLKAKLIQMRDQETIEEVKDFLRKQ